MLHKVGMTAVVRARRAAPGEAERANQNAKGDHKVRCEGARQRARRAPGCRNLRCSPKSPSQKRGSKSWRLQSLRPRPLAGLPSPRQMRAERPCRRPPRALRAAAR
eukprot:6425776-Prymnesium_polylepis.1